MIGRKGEIAVVSACLDSEPRGPRALLVEGEAGIGKSTVWFEAVRLAEARGYRVLRARPAESEAKLSYATLADVVGPAFDEARAQLPHPQELALAAVLRLEESGSTVANRASSSGDCTANALHHAQCAQQRVEFTGPLRPERSRSPRGDDSFMGF